MDADLYDEFGNYIGPDLDSDDEDDQEELQNGEGEGSGDEAEGRDVCNFLLIWVNSLPNYFSWNYNFT